MFVKYLNIVILILQKRCRATTPKWRRTLSSRSIPTSGSGHYLVPTDFISIWAFAIRPSPSTFWWANTWPTSKSVINQMCFIRLQFPIWNVLYVFRFFVFLQSARRLLFDYEREKTVRQRLPQTEIIVAGHQFHFRMIYSYMCNMYLPRNRPSQINYRLWYRRYIYIYIYLCLYKPYILLYIYICMRLLKSSNSFLICTDGERIYCARLLRSL